MGPIRLAATSAFALLASLAGAAAETQLTIYNQNFGVVKDTRALELKAGENDVRLTDITAHVEPDSVILRDLGKDGRLTILEQNYESEPLSEGLLLNKLEGKEIGFELDAPLSGEKRIVRGRILRSGYVPHAGAYATFGGQYAQQQMAAASGAQPIVEVEGKLVFGLPGKPIFDAIDPESFLKPTLLWKLDSAAAGKREVELSYLTGGMRWEATYNLVAPESGDVFDLIGWVTLENMSGKDFPHAAVKLMAGDVARAPQGVAMDALAGHMAERAEAPAPGVSEKAFDEYHLYNLTRPVDLLDREIKQVEFLQAQGVHGQRIYVYDGALYGQWSGYNSEGLRQQEAYGAVSQKKVSAMLEFKNARDNGLGLPLPAGVVKLYRADSDGRREFVGEDRIDHTPKDETVRLSTGKSFDLAGERKRTAYFTDSNRRVTEESFSIRVSNHKTTPAEIRVVEHFNRAENWEVVDRNAEFRALDSHAIEFPVALAPDETKTVTYRVRYTW